MSPLPIGRFGSAYRRGEMVAVPVRLVLYVLMETQIVFKQFVCQ